MGKDLKDFIHVIAPRHKWQLKNKPHGNTQTTWEKTERQTARRHNCTGLQAAGVDAIPYASAATEHAIACTVFH